MQETFAYLKQVLGIKYLPFSLSVAPEGSASSEVNIRTSVAPADSPAVASRSGTSPNNVFTASLAQDLEALARGVDGCTRCKLSKNRRNLVFGSGSSKATIMFIAESPSEDDDNVGQVFQGAPGDLLTKMILAMGLKREDTYLTSIVKCRTPGQRGPESDEVHECAPFLLAQIRLVNPKVLVALGSFAAQSLLRTDEALGQLRGRVLTLPGAVPRKVIATQHPLYLLNNPGEKKAAWDDLKLAMKELKGI